MGGTGRDEERGLLACIDGVITKGAGACVPVTDRGFLFGDSIYEVVRTYRGRPFALKQHLQRLSRSGAMLGLKLPVPVAVLDAEVRATLQAAKGPSRNDLANCGFRGDRMARREEGAYPSECNRRATQPGGMDRRPEWSSCPWAGTEHDESYIRVIVTRGSGPINLDPALARGARRIIIVTRLVPFPSEWYERGVAIALVPSGRCAGGVLPGGAKSGNYLVNLMALAEARRRGATEAVLLDAQGRVAEGSSTNVFLIRGSRLVTPPLAVGILEGITRGEVMDLARSAGLDVAEEEVLPGDLQDADEVFLTSTLREVLPVVQVDDRTVGQGQVGPLTRRLHRLYLELTAQDTICY